MILVDANVLIDLATNDRKWESWSRKALFEAGNRDRLAINPIIFAEVSLSYPTVEAMDAALPPDDFARLELPYAAGFLAGVAFRKYRKSGGSKTSPLPDFYIGAHAAVDDMELLTRDRGRYATYFPTLKLIAP
jgi:predicted nucleic acid-binding protein